MTPPTVCTSSPTSIPEPCGCARRLRLALLGTDEEEVAEDPDGEERQQGEQRAGASISTRCCGEHEVGNARVAVMGDP